MSDKDKGKRFPIGDSKPPRLAENKIQPPPEPKPKEGPKEDKK